MPFITQDKTNWKFLLIVVILAVIVGGGILAYQYWWLPREEVKAPEVKAEEITITSPSKGEMWKVGEAYQIRWAPSDPKGTVGIILSDTRISSASLSKVWQVENIPDTGNYFLTVPEVLPGDAYQIYIGSKEGYGYSGLFSIISKDETANWKTYRNEEYGFEVRHPEDWRIVEEKEYPTRPWNENILDIIIVSGKKGDSFYAPIMITIWSNKEKLPIREWFQKTYPKDDISKLHNFGLSGMRFSKWPNWVDSFYFSSEDKIYCLSPLEIQERIENQNQMMEKIVSTFKVLSKDETAD